MEVFQPPKVWNFSKSIIVCARSRACVCEKDYQKYYMSFVIIIIKLLFTVPKYNLYNTRYQHAFKSLLLHIFTEIFLSGKNIKVQKYTMDLHRND